MTYPLDRAARSDEEPERGVACSVLLEQIYAAATESVAVNGFQGLSMEDVALRARCSRATVYRRVGGKEAIRGVVLNEAVARMTSTVAQAVDHLHGQERVAAVILASLDAIRADPVAAALLSGPAAAYSVDSAVTIRFTGTVAYLTGIACDDTAGCELVSRITLALLCWPLAERDAETAIIHRFVTPAVMA